MAYDKNEEAFERSSPLLNKRSRLRHRKLLGWEVWHKAVWITS